MMNKKCTITCEEKYDVWNMNVDTHIITLHSIQQADYFTHLYRSLGYDVISDVDKFEAPIYVKLKDFDTCLSIDYHCCNEYRYKRFNGAWSVPYIQKGDKLYADARLGNETDSKELIEVSRAEWLKNEGFTEY